MNNKQNLYVINLQLGCGLNGYTNNRKNIQWIDIPFLKYKLNNSNKDLVFTNLNVLSFIDEIQLCTKYIDVCKDCEKDYDKEACDNYAKYYELLPSWYEDISHIRRFNNLPKNAKQFISFVEDCLSQKIKYISLKDDTNNFIVR